MSIHNRTPFLLCVIGGILMIIAGANGAIGIFRGVNGDLVDILNPDFVIPFEFIMGLLSMLALLGGAMIILGGFLMTTHRVSLARDLVLVFVMVGVIGLGISLVQALIMGDPAFDLGAQIIQSVGWVGAILSIDARIIAEQKPMSAQ